MSSPVPTPLIIKTYYTPCSGIVDTRRFQLDSTTQQTPYQQILSLLEKHYGQQHFSLKYKDDDGDVCSVGSQLELSEAFRVYNGNVLKLDVTVAAAPLPTPTPTPSVFPSSSASTTSSIAPARSHVSDFDDDHDVISLDGSISDFEPDDINRIPSPIPSDVFDPSIMSAPASHVGDELDESLVTDMSTSHVTSPQSDMIHVDALDVLPSQQAEAVVDVDVAPVSTPVVDMAPVSTTPVVDVAPVSTLVVDVTPVPTEIEQVIIPVDVAEPTPTSTSTSTSTPVIEQVTEVVTEPQQFSPVIEPISPVAEPGATAPITTTPVDVPTSSPVTSPLVSSPVPAYMTQSMTEQKYETPDEKHGQEWTCHACTFINVPHHGITATACEICGSPRINMSITQHGITTPLSAPIPPPRSSPLASVMAFAKDMAKDVIKAITPAATPTPAFTVAPVVQASTPVVETPVVVGIPVDATPAQVPVPAVPAPTPKPLLSAPIATVATSTTPAPTAVPVHTPAPYVHHGWRCDGCNVAPIVGTRYKCTMCPGSYDLCESCESAGVHDPSHVMIKMRAPPGHSAVPPVPVFPPPHFPPHPLMPPHHIPPHLGLPPHFGGGHDMGSMGHPYVPRPYVAHPLTRPPPRPRAEFIASPTPDGFVVPLGTQPTVHKVWSLRNSGTIPWPRGAAFVHISGKLVPLSNDGGESIVTMLPECAPGAIVHIACDIAVPQVVGRYRGHYRLMTVHRERFGPKVWVCIEVVENKKEETVEVKEDAVVPAAVLAVDSAAPVVSAPAAAPVSTPTPAPVSPPTPPPVSISPSATLAPPPFKYSQQLSQLQEMGFTNVDLCKWLLLNNNGDFNVVCEWLLKETR